MSTPLSYPLNFFKLTVRLPRAQEEPTFPLVNVPDHTLNEEDLKEKRRQRLMKAGYDARIRAKAERDNEKRLAEEERRRDQEMRDNDFQGWLRNLRMQHGVRSAPLFRGTMTFCWLTRVFDSRM